MKNIRFPVLVCLVVVLLALPIAGCAQQATEETITLVFSFHDPDTNHQNVGIYQPWFDMIEERTDGRVQFECHYNGELVSVQDAYDAVINGTVDIAVILPSTMAQFPLDQIVATPFFDIFTWRPSRVYNELYQEYPEFQAEYSEVKPLILYCMSPGFIGTTEKEVRTLEDNAGLKMITADPFASERAQALGQVPVSCPPPEFYTTLEKGIADGGDVVTLPEMITYNWADVINNITLVPFLHMACAVIMNKDKWESLPDDIQEIIDDLIPEAIDLADRCQILAYKDALTRLPTECGTTIITLSPSELARFAAADEPVRDAFIASLDAEGLPATQINDDYRTLSEKYAAPEYEINP
jgi:TRAP-type C4-dicarboxylate transport system substrate-binding protein